MPTTKYLLFSGEAFYPKGGFWDFQGIFDDQAKAKKQAVALQKSPDCHDWYQILDAETLKIVEAEGDSCYGEVEDLLEMGHCSHCDKFPAFDIFMGNGPAVKILCEECKILTGKNFVRELCNKEHGGGTPSDAADCCHPHPCPSVSIRG